jgi:hypothetical protein
MLRALNLTISPEAGWQKTALNPPNAFVVLLASILPIMILGLAVEGYALMKYGEVFGELGRHPVTAERVLKYTIFYGVASLAVILAGAGLLRNVGSTFNLQVSYGAWLTLLGIVYIPIFLARMLDAVPAIHTWICWGIGVALALRVLYHGVGGWLRPEQTKGFGLFLITFIYILVLSGLVHFASIQVLQGKLLKNVGERPEVAFVPPAILAI